MSYKIMFFVSAIVAVAFGAFLIFAPEAGLKQFAMTSRAQEIFMARAIGAALASVGILLWFAKDVEGDAQKGLGMGALAGTVLALIVTIIGVATMVKGLGWVALVVEVVLGLGFAFMIFLQPKMKE